MFYGLGAYSRERGNMPELPVINMFVEASPSSDKGVILQSRPGLASLDTVGSGPIYGMFQKNGAIGGFRYAVSGSSLYKTTTSVGTITGSGAVSFAASPEKLLVTRGEDLHTYNGTTFASESLPDGQDTAAVAYLAGYEVAIAAGTNQFYFRPYTEDVFDGLDFANAENEPDELLDILVIDDILVFLGAESVEFWPKTGDATIPFAPTEGRVFEKGVIDTGCATRFDNTFAWIGNEKVIYIAANVPQRISDNGIEERLANSDTFSAYAYFHEGTEYLVIRLSQGSWQFSAASRQWSEYQSYGRSNWRARCAISGPVFGDDENGTIWQFGDTHVDAGGVLERRFRGAIPLKGGSFSVNNVRLTVNVGETQDLSGSYADPNVEIRTSRDSARTFSSFRSTALGRQGNYRTLVEWRALGMFDSPGMVAEFRVTDPVPFRVAAVAINEPGGGRSR